MVQTLAGVGVALSLFLLVVLGAKRPFRRADLWLAVWLFAQSVFCAGVLLALTMPQRTALAILIAGQFALFLLGPAQYLYAASAIGAPRHYLWHLAMLVAPVLLVLGTLPLTSVRAEAGAIVADLSVSWLLVVPPACLALATFYPLAVLRLVHRRRERLEDQLSDLGAADPGWLQVWAWSVLALLFSMMVAFGTSAVSVWPLKLHMATIMTMQVAHIAYVGQRGLTRPGVFFASAKLIEPWAGREKGAVDRVLAAEEYARIQALFAQEKPHLAPNLTAEMLADKLGWAPGRLTQALRHGGGVNFFTAVNAARVREVQDLAGNPQNAQVSLLDLAHRAGFGSKTAFYDAFQRHVGCTPAAWKRRDVGA